MWILIKISLKFVPKGQINNIPALVQIMAWGQLCAKPLSEPMMFSLLMHICITRPQWVNDWGLAAYSCIFITELGRHWLSKGLVSSHNLIQYWLIIDRILRNEPQWNMNRNRQISHKENIFKKMSAKWQPFCLSLNGFKYSQCRYNAVQFITILHTTQRLQQRNMNQTWNSQQTPHTSP